MSKFKYTAVDSIGKEKKGKIEAVDQAAATATLKTKGLFPTSLEEMAKGLLGEFYKSLSGKVMSSNNNLMENADKKPVGEHKDELYNILVALAQEHLPKLDLKEYKLLEAGKKHLTDEAFKELVLNKYGEHIGFGDGQNAKTLKAIFDSLAKDEETTIKSFLDTMYKHSTSEKTVENAYGHIVSPIYTDIVSRSQKHKLDLSHDLLSKADSQGIKVDMNRLIGSNILSSLRAYHKHSEDGIFKEHKFYTDIGFYADKKPGPIIKDISNKIPQKKYDTLEKVA